MSSSCVRSASSIHFHFLSFSHHLNSPTFNQSFSGLPFMLFFSLSPLTILDFLYFSHSPISFHLVLFSSALALIHITYTGAISLPPVKHNTKISISLATTFRPCWIIHIHISAPNPFNLRKVLLFSTLSNEMWIALFYSLWRGRLAEVGLMEQRWSEFLEAAQTQGGGYHVFPILWERKSSIVWYSKEVRAAESTVSKKFSSAKETAIAFPAMACMLK